MRNVKLPVILLALGMSLGVALLISRVNQPPPPATAGPELARVVVARADIAPGALLRSADLKVVAWPADAVPDGAQSDAAVFAGRVAAARIYSGEPVLERRLAPEGTRSGISAALGDGFRAVTVRVDEVVGVAGFVLPGTRVDVLATVDDEREHRTQVVLQNIEILAADQRTEPGPDGKPQKLQLATLLVSLEDAEKLVHVAHRGRIHLALRGALDTTVETTDGATPLNLFSAGRAVPHRVIRPAAPVTPPHTVEIFHRSQSDLKRFPR
jgi:pilus assembly protein CpaB